MSRPLSMRVATHLNSGMLFGFPRVVCRYIAVGVNTLMVLSFYLEYLWAQEYPELAEYCSDREALDILQRMNCSRRYTFSDSMVRGWNLEVFAAVGVCVASCYVILEHDRLQHLQELLSAELARKEEAHEASDKGAAVKRSMLCLRAYALCVHTACISVLLLAPCSLHRPVLHYASTGLVVGLFASALCFYALMPLQAAAGDMTETADGHSLAAWAQRHRRMLPTIYAIIALHFVLAASGAASLHFQTDMYSILFGLLEVMQILAYQAFIMQFAVDDPFVVSDGRPLAVGL